MLPIFFLPYFAWKRWWSAFTAALVTGAVASVAPMLVFGPERFVAYVRHWLALSAGSWPVRKGNQSVYAMVDRLYTHDAVIWDVAHRRLTAVARERLDRGDQRLLQQVLEVGARADEPGDQPLHVRRLGAQHALERLSVTSTARLDQRGIERLRPTSGLAHLHAQYSCAAMRDG